MEPESLYFYHLTLQRQTNFVHCCVGHFVDYKPHQLHTNDGAAKKRKSRRELQFCIATETHIELYDVEEGNLNRIFVLPIFATITSMQRLPTENNYSYLALVSDSGNLTIARFVYDAGIIRLHTLFNEPFARSGIRRLSPQAHLDVDPHGRCILLSAFEKNKLCYLTEFKNNELSVSSPLEANRPNFITLDTTACDVAFDNPTFASIEEEFTDKARSLVFYMLDLGLNLLTKKNEYRIAHDANFIMAVPNLEKYNIRTKESTYEDVDDELNPFVIVGFKNHITLRDSRGIFDVKVQLPSRSSRSTDTIIIAGKLHKLKKDFFILLQSQVGDLYKVKIVPNAENAGPLLTVTYFDTIAPSEDLLIFRNGFLFSNSEFGDSCLYQFESLGNDDDFTKILTSENPDKTLNIDVSEEPQNLEIVDRIKAINPSISSAALDTTPLTLLTQTKNSVQQLTTGVNLQEFISSPLPPNSNGIWTVRIPSEGEHRLLFISLPKTTMVLKIDDGTVEELGGEVENFKKVTDKTVFVGVMGERSIIQVCTNSLIQVVALKSGTEYRTELEWFPPAGIRITKATCTSTQLVLALSNREIAYFEMDTSSGSDVLNEYQDRVEMEERITSITFPSTHRADFLAVGVDDSSVKILNVKHQDESFLEVVSMQALVSSPHDLKLIHSGNSIQLHIGLTSGVYIRSKVDSHDGRLFDVRTRYLGTNPVSVSILESVNVRGNLDTEDDGEEENNEQIESNEDIDESNGPALKVPCAILHSNRTWISYEADNMMLVRPLLLSNTRSIAALAPFRTQEMKQNGCCAIGASGNLIIGRLNDFASINSWFQQNTIVPDTEDENNGDNDNGSEPELKVLDDSKLYSNRRILSDLDNKKLSYIVQNSVDGNSCRVGVCRSQKFFSVESSEQRYYVIENCTCVDAQLAKFGSNDLHLILSTTNGLLKTFLVDLQRKTGEKTFNLIFLHDTQVDDVVSSMVPFGDKLLVPIFGSIVLYGKGRKQLLKKSITATPPSITKVTSLAQWENDRLVLGDVSESVMLFQYDAQLNQFIRLADDVIKRYVVAVEFLDRSTVIGSDKFGNVWTLRLPQQYERIVNEEYAIFMSNYHDRPSSDISPNIMECPFKLALTNHFYVNDILIKFHILKGVLMSDRPLIIYIGLQGTVGCLIPLITKREVDFFVKLEKTMRDADDLFYLDNERRLAKGNAEDIDDPNEISSSQISIRTVKSRPVLEGAYSVVLRDHLAYRSYYAPVKSTIDGDLCETFLSLYPSEQQFLCQSMMGERKGSVSSIARDINEMRVNYV